MKKALWGLGVLLTILLLCSLPMGVALADESKELVLLDNGVEMTEVTVKEETVSGQKYTVYQVTYHEGLFLTIDPTTKGGESITDGDPQSVRITGVGDYAYTFVIANSLERVLIRVSPIPVTLAWVEDSLTCEYGQTPRPQAVVTSGQQDVPLTYHNLDSDDDFAVSRVGSYTVVAQAGGNYAGSLTGTFVVNKCNASIVVSNPPTEGVVWDGPYQVLSRMGVTVQEGYDLLQGKIKVLSNGSAVNSGTLGSVGSYQISFCFDDNNSNNFARSGYNLTDTYSLTLLRAPLSITWEAGGISVPYRPDPSYPQLIYDSFANDTVRLVSAGAKAEGLDLSLLSIAYLDQDKTVLSQGPIDVGSYWVRLSYPATATYDAAGEVDVPLTIVKADISSQIVVYLNGMAVSPKVTSEFTYGDSFAYAHSLPSVYAELEQSAVGNYQRKVGETWDTLDEAPTSPGTYRYVVVLTDRNVTATSSRSFVIARAALTVESLDELLTVPALTYGDEIDLRPDVPDYQEDGEWIVMYEGEGYPRSVTPPIAAGTYSLALTLDGDSFYVFSQVYPDCLTIVPKPLAVTVEDKTVAYGNAWAGNTLRQGIDVSFDSGAMGKGSDEAELLSALSLVAMDGETRYASPDRVMVVGNRYDLVLEGSHPNYSITAQNGHLYVSRRTLTVTASSATVYKGASERDLGVELANVCPWDDEEALIALFGVRLKDDLEWEEAVSSVTTRALSYELEPYKKADSPLLDNYNPTYRTGKLTVRSTTLVTSDPDNFGVEGQFSQEDSLTLVKGSPSQYQGAVSSVLKGYVAKTVYEINKTVSTERNTGIVVSITAPQDAKILVSYDGVNYDEVDFSYVGDKAVFSQTVMATRYVVCVKRDIPWTLIGAIGGGVVGVLVIVIVAVVATKKKKQKKQQEELQAVTTAPTKGLQHKSEEEELDELIQNFDESTVRRELTPAERIALREKEEKYNQYRLRLQRMRGSGDKSMQDKLAGLQLGAADDDAIIARMIAEDEARAKELEEELLKEQEEEEQSKPAAVILERKEGELKQRSFAPTVKDDDDDVDI